MGKNVQRFMLRIPKPQFYFIYNNLKHFINKVDFSDVQEQVIEVGEIYIGVKKEEVMDLEDLFNAINEISREFYKKR